MIEGMRCSEICGQGYVCRVIEVLVTPGNQQWVMGCREVHVQQIRSGRRVDDFNGSIRDSGTDVRSQSYAMFWQWVAVRVTEYPALVTADRMAPIVGLWFPPLATSTGIKSSCRLIAVLVWSSIVVPFATVPGFVACIIEWFGKRCQVWGERPSEIKHLIANSSATRQDFGATGRADRVCTRRVQKNAAAAHQPVQMGCLDDRIAKCGDAV